MDWEVIGSRGKMRAHVSMLFSAAQSDVRITRRWSPEEVFPGSTGRWKYINKIVRITEVVENYSMLYWASQGSSS